MGPASMPETEFMKSKEHIKVEIGIRSRLKCRLNFFFVICVSLFVSLLSQVTASPYLVGSIDTHGSAEDVYVSGSYAYVIVSAEQDNEFQVIDINNPQETSMVSRLKLPEGGVPTDVYVSESYAFVTTQGDYDNLYIIDISNPKTPAIISSVGTAAKTGLEGTGFEPAIPPMPGFATSVYVSDSFAYVADWFSGLNIIDISTPQTPTVVSSLEMPEGMGGLNVCVSAPYAYVVNQKNLYVINISNSQNPVIVGSVATPLESTSTRAVYVVDSYVYVNYETEWQFGEAGLQVIDISNPQKPVVVGSVGKSSFDMGPAQAAILSEF